MSSGLRAFNWILIKAVVCLTFRSLKGTARRSALQAAPSPCPATPPRVGSVELLVLTHSWLSACYHHTHNSCPCQWAVIGIITSVYITACSHAKRWCSTGHVGVPVPCNVVKLVDVEEMNYFASNGEGEASQCSCRIPHLDKKLAFLILTYL